MARGKKRKPRKNRGPKDFRMFPELPIELRLRIWEMSIPDPQLIAIGCEFGYDSHSMQRRRTKDCAAFYKIPALLHTNKESRSVAESVYREEFADRLGGNGIWMDISKDILCFRRVLACDIFFRGKAECVRTDSDFRSNKPLVERLHALAFDFLAPNFEKSPQILTRMGKPQTIYCLGEFAETASHQGKWVEVPEAEGREHDERANENLACRVESSYYEAETDQTKSRKGFPCKSFLPANDLISADM
ncbi:hypothetical protein BDZ45DRAFT_748663 [Acephala macrosclerotiorum]|nr:hypothetical protein BDZ45DRAFT_748663 [Acephala macrosclerotiorum]